MSDKAKRTVVVTGGSRGIGRAICRELTGEGVHVFFNYFNPGDPEGERAAAAETEKIVAAAGGIASSESFDVTAAEALNAFFKRIVDETGRIDVLVNNAGITRDSLIARMREDAWDSVIDINLKGVFRCTQLAAKTMMSQRSGKIINISSIVGITGNAGQTNYAASKAGIIGFTKSVAKELGSRNIQVNAIAPGYVETDMTGSLKPEQKAVLTKMIPLGRTAQPGEIAGVVRFLASPDADYITGQVLCVDGGLTMIG